MKRRSKRYKALKEQVKIKKVNSFETAIGEIKRMGNTKFSESIDISLKVNLKKVKGADNSLKTVVELPNGNGKKLKLPFYVTIQSYQMLKKVEQKFLVRRI